VHAEKQGVFLSSGIHPIIPPSLVEPVMKILVEAAHQCAEDLWSLQLGSEEHCNAKPDVFGADPEMGRKALAKDPMLEPMVRRISPEPAECIQLLIQLNLEGRHVALGLVLLATQKWCVD